MRKLPFLLWGGTILFLHVPCQAGTIPLTYQQKCIHLLNRLTFGPKPGDLERVCKMGAKAFIEEQLNPEGIDNSQCEMELVSYPTLKMSSYELFQAYPPPQFVFKKAKLDGVDPEKLKAINEKPRRILEELSAAKLLRILDSNPHLQEIMTDFC